MYNLSQIENGNLKTEAYSCKEENGKQRSDRLTYLVLEDVARQLKLISCQSNAERAPNGDLVEQSKRFLDHRRAVDKVMGIHGLSTSPAWDILLDVFHSDQSEHKLSVTAVCVGSDCPHTTALRWLKFLVDEELVKRQQDPADGRRAWVSLTREGEQKVVAALNSF